MTDVKWKTPAGRQQGSAAYGIADMLKGRPGEWAVIEEFEVPVVPDGADEDTKAAVQKEIRKVRARASSRASLIKQDRSAAFRVPADSATPAAFTAVSRSEEEDGQKVLRVYAIYLEGDSAAEYLQAQREKAEAKAASKGAAADDSGEVAAVGAG